MRTNQNLIRKMGDFDVMQRTQDGMFNATSLLKQWNDANSRDKRDLDNFWKATHLDKLMAEIAENELNFKTVDFTELKDALSKTSKGRMGGTWMNPILFIKFAMYLSPRFEYHVLRFVADQLLAYRNDAGDSYKDMCASVAKIVKRENISVAIQNVSKANNHIVYGEHVSEIRNKRACEDKLKELDELQRDIYKLINNGFVKSYDQLLSYLRKLWRDKYTPKVLTA